MKIVRARVVDGRIELPPDTARDGTEVAVLVPDDECTFALSEDEVRALQESVDQASRGEVVDGATLLGELGGAAGS